MVRPKKFLGQHFLKDKRIAERIVNSLTGHGNYKKVLEIGPGMGVLTDFLLDGPYDLFVIELDRESVAYLNQNQPKLKGKIIEGDFFKTSA